MDRQGFSTLLRISLDRVGDGRRSCGYFHGDCLARLNLMHPGLDGGLRHFRLQLIDQGFCLAELSRQILGVQGGPFQNRPQSKVFGEESQDEILKVVSCRRQPAE